LGTATIAKGREQRWYRWDLDVATVQGWISGKRENNGLALWGKAPGKAVAFFSSEHDDVKSRPVLTLTLSVDPVPGSIARFVVSTLSWEDFVADCGRKASEKNDARSAKVFGEKYKGQVVAWSGVVASVQDRVVGGGYLVSITMLPSESLIGSSDLVLRLPAPMREKALALNKGDKVSFVCQIASQGGLILDHILDVFDLRANSTNDDD
jgi:hypothetical protein